MRSGKYISCSSKNNHSLRRTERWLNGLTRISKGGVIFGQDVRMTSPGHDVTLRLSLISLQPCHWVRKMIKFISYVLFYICYIMPPKFPNSEKLRQKCHKCWQWKELVTTTSSIVMKWKWEAIPIILQRRPSSLSAMVLGTAVSV